MLTDIRLQKFRSYRDASFVFGRGVNIIVGPNASGKTNLLEAIGVVCRGSSFRAKDSELVAFGAPWARIDAHDSVGGRTVKLLMQEHGFLKKEFVIYEQKLSRLSLAKTIPTVLFEPNHLLLLHGSPDARREYLDTLLEHIVSGYGRVRRDYRRTLAQRNALLKRGPAARSQLFAWDIRLSEVGARVAAERYRLVAQLSKKIDKLYKELAPYETATVDVSYRAISGIDQYASTLLAQLEKRHSRDIERGFTSVGPHREDLVLTFDDRNAAVMASRGETRTLLLALKILELQLIEECVSVKPLLLLDDVFSELDRARRQALTEVINQYQTFITTTDADVVAQHFRDDCVILTI